MTLAVLDDLFFSIKIKNAVKLPAWRSISRSPDAVLDTIRAKRPRLVIFDLDAEDASARRARR